MAEKEKKIPVGLRLTGDGKTLLDQLTSVTGLDQGGVVELAIRDLAQTRHIIDGPGGLTRHDLETVIASIEFKLHVQESGGVGPGQKYLEVSDKRIQVEGTRTLLGKLKQLKKSLK